MQLALVDSTDQGELDYVNLFHRWIVESFKKVTVRSNQREFNKLMQLDNIIIARETTAFDTEPACIIKVIDTEDINAPNVLKYAKLWKPLTLAEKVGYHDQIYKG